MNRLVPLLAVLLCLTLQSILLAGPTVLVGIQVPAAKRIEAKQVDHSPWSKLLAKHVDEKGLVGYRKWKASKADMKTLDDYLEHLSYASFTKEAKKEVKLAYWINAYNAVTVHGILREYPTTSIRNHTARVFGYNIWDDLQLHVADKQYSLNQIEHEILRKLDEPRIHFAIVCASIGCPRLLKEAYEPARLEQQLTENAKHFFADKQKFRVDLQQRTIYVSPILDWFEEDFGESSAEQMKRVAPWVPEQARELAASETAEVEYLEYDWGLNDKQPPK